MVYLKLEKSGKRETIDSYSRSREYLKVEYSSLHVCRNFPYFFSTVLHLWIWHSECVQSPGWGHFGYFKYFAVTNNFLVNSLVQMSSVVVSIFRAE